MAASDHSPEANGEGRDAELVDATSQLGLAASSRFEFEPSKGNEGSKILLVEWDTSIKAVEPEASSAEVPEGHDENGEADPGTLGGWEVSWQGKSTTLPIRDKDAGTRKRVYFWLPPGAAVPGLVTITHPNSSKLVTKPLPAIFPAGLGANGGKRGVLHTIWAKKRLAELEDEIAQEMKANGEGIGLEMALQEKQWLLEYFGLGSNSGLPAPVLSPAPLAGPLSPKSPIVGRLGEKLRGLKLATSPADLAPVGAAKHRAPVHNPEVRTLSPGSADMAISSFSSSPGSKPQSQVAAGAVSMAAILDSSNGSARVDEGDTEDELFALPMSPRSPEMKRSPFSLL